MRTKQHIFLALAGSLASPAAAATEALAVSYDIIPGAYSGRYRGPSVEIPMSTRLELGSWTLRTRTSLHLAPLEPLTLHDENGASPTFAGQSRAVAGDTRISIERALNLTGPSWLTLKAQARLPTAGQDLYLSRNPLEGAVALEFTHYTKDWMFWATGTQRFRDQGTEIRPRQDNLDIKLGAARWFSRQSMAGLSMTHWQSSYKGGRPGSSLGMFFSNKFTGNRKGELRAYVNRQFSSNYSVFTAAMMLRLQLD